MTHSSTIFPLGSQVHSLCIGSYKCNNPLFGRLLWPFVHVTHALVMYLSESVCHEYGVNCTRSKLVKNHKYVYSSPAKKESYFRDLGVTSMDATGSTSCEYHALANANPHKWTSIYNGGFQDNNYFLGPLVIKALLKGAHLEAVASHIFPVKSLTISLASSP